MKPLKNNLIHSTVGFTLIELLIVLTVMAIFMAIAVPNLFNFINDARMTSQANDLLADLLYARSEAASRGVHVVVCPSTNGTSCSTTASDWSNGRIVFADANGNRALDTGEIIIKSTPSISGGSTLTPVTFNSLVAIPFSSYGALLDPGNSGTFKLCPSSPASGRLIAVPTNGRPSVTRVSCP